MFAVPKSSANFLSSTFPQFSHLALPSPLGSGVPHTVHSAASTPIWGSSIDSWFIPFKVLATLALTTSASLT